MISSVYGNLSAMRAFGDKMSVTANNVANAESEEYKKKRALLTEGSEGDVVVDIVSVETPGAIRVEAGMETRELSNVDLAEEIVETIPTQRGYEANLTVIKTQDEMTGTILDILG
jgi:flagellar hook protein FlgE